MIADLGEMYVDQTTVRNHSQAVSLESPFNAVQGSLVVYVLGTLEVLTLQFQVSDDLENWSNPSTSSPWKQTVTGPLAYALLTKITGIAARYIRVESTTDVDKALFALTLNVSEQ